MSLALRLTNQSSASLTEHDLVAAVRRGDDRAFEELYARYRSRIGSYVVGMLDDHARAEDVAQEVFIAALRRLRETDRPISFKPWIYEIAKNACIDEFRRTRRAQEVPLEPGDDRDTSRGLVSLGPTPDAAIASSRPSSASTICAAPSAACRRAITGSSSCASWKGSPTSRSARAWG
jgi:DNA-directed RNA polymerase specialized sigma24 family protein